MGSENWSQGSTFDIININININAFFLIQHQSKILLMDGLLRNVECRGLTPIQ